MGQVSPWMKMESHYPSASVSASWWSSKKG
jgi:hypothetical protein